MEIPALIPVLALVVAGLQLTVHYLNLHNRSRKSLTWKLMKHRRVKAVDEIRQFGDQFQVSFNWTAIENLFHSTIQIRNTGNDSIENQPILVEFGSCTRILNVKLDTIPRKEFGSLTEDKESSKFCQRRYIVGLMEPKDTITFEFITTGNNIEPPKLTAKGKGLAFMDRAETPLYPKIIVVQLLAIIMVALILAILLPGKPTTVETGWFLLGFVLFFFFSIVIASVWAKGNAYGRKVPNWMRAVLKVGSQLPIPELLFIRLTFLTVILAFLTFSLGLWPGQQPNVEENSFWFGIMMFVGLSFIVFRVESRAGNVQRNPEQIKNATIARLQMILVVALVAFVFVEYLGYHDEFMQLLNWTQARSERLINALLH